MTIARAHCAKARQPRQVSDDWVQARLRLQVDRSRSRAVAEPQLVPLEGSR